MILIQRYLTICKFFLLKKRKKYWNELFQVENPVEFYFISRVHIAAIVSLHPQFTLSYHLPPRTISISQVAPLGSAKMLISLSTDRDVDVQNGTIYIYRHARVVKEREGPWRRAPVTRNCGEIHEPDGISPDSWLLAWVTSFISAPGSGVSRVNSRRLSNSMEITWLPCGRPIDIGTIYNLESKAARPLGIGAGYKFVTIRFRPRHSPR